MQEKINEYFNKLCKEKFFRNDEALIGKAKDVIDDLEQNADYVKNDNSLDKQEANFIIKETSKLVKKIKKEHPNLDDVIKLYDNEMGEFTELVETEILYNEMKEYYEEEYEDEN